MWFMYTWGWNSWIIYHSTSWLSLFEVFFCVCRFLPPSLLPVYWLIRNNHWDGICINRCILLYIIGTIDYSFTNSLEAQITPKQINQKWYIHTWASCFVPCQSRTAPPPKCPPMGWSHVAYIIMVIPLVYSEKYMEITVLGELKDTKRTWLQHLEFFCSFCSHTAEFSWYARQRLLRGTTL